MKKRIPFIVMSLAATLIFSMSLMAQEKTEITVQVKEDGKVVSDTTYQFDNADEAKHAMKMLEIFSGDGDHGDLHTHGEYVYVMKSGDGDDCVKEKHIKVVVSGDEDGTWHVDSKDLHEINEDEDVYIIKGDSDDVHVELKEILKEHGDGENLKVIVITKDVDDSDDEKK